MTLQLRLASAERQDDGERQKLSQPEIKPCPCVVIAETIRRQESLDMDLSVGRVLVQAVDYAPEDFSNCVSGVVVDWPSSGSSTPRLLRISFVA